MSTLRIINPVSVSDAVVAKLGGFGETTTSDGYFLYDITRIAPNIIDITYSLTTTDFLCLCRDVFNALPRARLFDDKIEITTNNPTAVSLREHTFQYGTETYRGSDYCRMSR